MVEMKRILSAAVIATTTLATLGLAGAGAVSAGTSSQAAAARIGNTYTKGDAGYKMGGGGWRFRSIKTTLTVPASTTQATSANIVLWSDADAVTLNVKSGGGPGSISYWISYWESSKSLAVSPSVGDQVTITINQGPSGTAFTAVDRTTGSTNTATESFYRYPFTEAWVTGGGPKWRTGAGSRLWAFKDTQLTSRNGTSGTILGGPWNAYRIIGTNARTGNVVLWPTYPWNNGHNFSVLLRAAS